RLICKAYSHLDQELPRSRPIAFCSVMDCRSPRLRQARFADSLIRRSLICKLKLLFESGSCARRCGPITNSEAAQHPVVALLCEAHRCVFGTHAPRVSQRRGYSYFLTTSAFSIIAMPPRSASLPFTVTFLPHKSASSSFIGLCSPTTRYALPSLTTPTGPPLLMHLAPQDCPCFSPTAL